MKKAVILLSGGIDSSTCVAIAKSQGYSCYVLTIDYGQRNYYELQTVTQVAKKLEVVEHRIVKLDIGSWGGSALTDHSLEVPHEFSKNIPITYVPARNTIFLATALAWAEVLETEHIFIGINAMDLINYPDCREDYFAAFEVMAKLATRAGREGKSFKIHAPLKELSKGEIIKWGVGLGVDYSLTLSCYDPAIGGKACGQCDPCRYRADGFREAGIKDVTHYASVSVD